MSAFVNTEFAIRLANGAAANEGRIEMFYGNQWAGVCNNGLSKVAADVACRQLGYPDAKYVWNNGYFGKGSGIKMVDSFQCGGSEPSLAACSHSKWGDVSDNCWLYKRSDVGVTCNMEQSTTPLPTTEGGKLDS